MTKSPAKAPEKKASQKTAEKPQNGATTPEKSAPVLNEAEVAEKIATLRSQVRESFGKVVMAMMTQPRYRHHTIGELAHLVLEPLTMDRIAIAYGKQVKIGAPDIAGFAIWASVSEEVDLKIREQIRAGVFPLRLKAEEWNSGKINWLLDVIAVDQKTAGHVIANFRQVAKDGELRMHPIIGRLVDEETLEKMKKAQVKEPVKEPAN